MAPHADRNDDMLQQALYKKQCDPLQRCFSGDGVKQRFIFKLCRTETVSPRPSVCRKLV